MQSRSSRFLRERLGVLRAEALRSGRRVYQLVVVGGVPVTSPRVRGEFSSVADALDAARRFGVSSCVVREWACMDAYRVHVGSVEWLLSWTRVASISNEAAAHSRAAEGGRSGGQRSVPRSDVNLSMPKFASWLIYNPS